MINWLLTFLILFLQYALPYVHHQPEKTGRAMTSHRIQDPYFVAVEQWVSQMPTIKTEDDVLISVSLPAYGVVCNPGAMLRAVPSYDSPAIYNLPQFGVVALHEQSADGQWVRVMNYADWLPISDLCNKENYEDYSNSIRQTSLVNP